MNKNLLIACVLILVAGGVYAYYSDNAMFRSQQMPQFAAESAPTTPESPVNDANSIGKHAVSWKFESQGEDKATGAPKTKVTVTWDGRSHDAGTYMGSCAEIDGSNGSLSAGEVSGVLCWFAGAGDEIGVFNENGKFVLKHGEQQEPSAEAQGFRGNFKTLLSL